MYQVLEFNLFCVHVRECSSYIQILRAHGSPHGCYKKKVSDIQVSLEHLIPVLPANRLCVDLWEVAEHVAACEKPGSDIL